MADYFCYHDGRTSVCFTFNYAKPLKWFWTYQCSVVKLGLNRFFYPFLTDPNWAKLTIIVVNMWIGIPATMLISTGIIQNLPEDQIEAARIDGANKWQIFKKYYVSTNSICDDPSADSTVYWQHQ